jgi:hypothetical protein
MFSGFQEILLIGLIIVGIIILPRMIKPQPPPPKMAPFRPGPRLSWTFRLAVVLSILWPVCWALYLKPWQRDGVSFAVVGIGPVVVGWSIKWVLAGMKNKR